MSECHGALQEAREVLNSPTFVLDGDAFQTVMLEELHDMSDGENDDADGMHSFMPHAHEHEHANPKHTRTRPIDQSHCPDLFSLAWPGFDVSTIKILIQLNLCSSPFPSQCSPPVRPSLLPRPRPRPPHLPTPSRTFPPAPAPRSCRLGLRICREASG